MHVARRPPRPRASTTSRCCSSCTARPTAACAASIWPSGSASHPPAWPASSRRSSAAGLVGRESHPGDARLALVVLTDAGARIVADVLPTAEEAATRVLGKIWNEAEQQQALALLQQVRS